MMTLDDTLFNDMKDALENALMFLEDHEYWNSVGSEIHDNLLDIFRRLQKNGY